MQPASSSSSLFSIERVVSLLTPVFAAISAVIVGWAAKHAPGSLPLTAAQLTALQVAGAAGAFGIAWKWLHGRQLFMVASADVQKTVGAALKDLHIEGPVLTEIDGLFKAHASQIEAQIAALAGKVEQSAGAPQAVDEIVTQVLQRVFGQVAAASGKTIGGGQGVPPQA